LTLLVGRKEGHPVRKTSSLAIASNNRQQYLHNDIAAHYVRNSIFVHSSTVGHTLRTHYSVLICKVECLYVSLIRLLPINSPPLRSTTAYDNIILNQQDPASALIHNSFALTVC